MSRTAFPTLLAIPGYCLLVKLNGILGNPAKFVVNQATQLVGGVHRVNASARSSYTRIMGRHGVSEEEAAQGYNGAISSAGLAATLLPLVRGGTAAAEAVRAARLGQKAVGAEDIFRVYNRARAPITDVLRKSVDDSLNPLIKGAAKRAHQGASAVVHGSKDALSNLCAACTRGQG